jgi:acetyl-CoA carboxylase biotin carboxyl carrier protein
MCRELAALVEGHGLSELIVDSKNLTLTFRRGPGGSTEGMTMVATQLAQPMAAAPAASAPMAPAAAAPVEPPVETGHAITSPFVGTFYRAPNPDSPPYCEVGQRVEKGQVLCIVEAMKLMNEIEADMAGNLEAILVDNGDPVEYGQTLFRIKP